MASCSISNLSECDPEDTLTQEVCLYLLPHISPTHLPLQASRQQQQQQSVCVFILSTYTDGAPPTSCQWFHQWLRESVDDFRVHKSLLTGLQFAVFGLGNSLYSSNYNRVSCSSISLYCCCCYSATAAYHCTATAAIVLLPLSLYCYCCYSATAASSATAAIVLLPL